MQRRWRVYRRGVIGILVAVSYAVPAVQAYDDSRISTGAAEKMERVLNDVLTKRRDGKLLPKVVVFTEKELNSYLYYKAGTQLPPNLRNLDLQLEQDSVVAQADLDLSQAKSAQASTIPDMFKRPLPIYLSGKLLTNKGWGYFQPESIRVGMLPVPVSVLDSIVKYVTERQTGKPHSLNDWFALPYGIKEIKIQKEKILISP